MDNEPGIILYFSHLHPQYFAQQFSEPEGGEARETACQSADSSGVGLVLLPSVSHAQTQFNSI